MTRGMLEDLSGLLADPARALGMPPAEAAGLLAKLSGVVAVLRVAAAAQAPDRDAAVDGMLTVQQAAAMAGVTVEQFYRRKRFRSAIVKLGHRTLRVNDRKLRRILAGTT